MTDTPRGMYIVLEGTGGVGKTTQVEMLAERLRHEGYAVRLFREPDIQSDLTARAIRLLTQDPRYPMNTKTEVLLYNAARSQSLEVIRSARKEGVICLCDRNFLTTLANQYYGRGDVPDYDAINNIISFAVGDMMPDMTIILDAPTSVLSERHKQRGQGDRFDNIEIEFLERARAGYLLEAKARNYPVILAIDSPEKIHQQIWEYIHGKPIKMSQDMVAPPIKTETVSEPQKENEPLLKKTKSGLQVTDAGKRFLDEAVTNTDSDIYAFKSTFNPLTAAAAMARLSRRFDDLRITILDEFAISQTKTPTY